MPDRAGAGTQVIAHIPLSQLRALPGAQDLEDAWIRARLGEDGYLTGKDAETAACDAPPSRPSPAPSTPPSSTR